MSDKITQAELKDYADKKRQYEELDGLVGYDGTLRKSLIERVLSSNEVEAGILAPDLKSYETKSTKYAEVLKDMQGALEAHPELLERLAELLGKYTTKKQAHRFAVVTVETEVVTVVKKKKVA